MKKQIKVFAPATVANVVCGFDVLGFALDYPGDEVILKLKEKPGITISRIEGDKGKLTLIPNHNAVSISIASFMKSIQSNQGLDIQLYKNMPLNSGLGSSAASAVAGVYAANELLGKPLSKEELLPFALQSEKYVCGSAHADNVAPALIGGFVLVRSYEPLDIVKIPVPQELYCTVVHPHISISTKEARQILKNQIPLNEVTQQMGDIAGMITGLLTNDYDLISRSMNDIIAEPVRSKLIPGFRRVKNAALEAGALGCGISGSGPSLFALCVSKKIAANTAESMQNVFSSIKIDSDMYISKINQTGVKVINN